jgi:hypothetical protein
MRNLSFRTLCFLLLGLLIKKYCSGQEVKRVETQEAQKPLVLEMSKGRI